MLLLVTCGGPADPSPGEAPQWMLLMFGLHPPTQELVFQEASEVFNGIHDAMHR
jgi:hypothetical protein